MKDIRTRLLLSAACFFLCLSIAAPVRAGKDAIRPRPPLPVNSEKVRELNNVAKLMSRSDRLLLLDNVVSFWKLRVSIGERNPKDTTGNLRSGGKRTAFSFFRCAHSASAPSDGLK